MTATKDRPAPAIRRSDIKPRFERPRGHLRDDIVGGAFTVAFFLLVAVFVLVLVWQRDVLTQAANDRVSAVAAVQEERVDEYIAAGITDARLVATRPSVLAVLAGDEPSPTQANAVLQGFVDVTPELVWTGVYDLDLNLISAAGETPVIPKDYLARARDGEVVGKVIPAEIGGLHLVGAPIFADGERLGVAMVAHSTRVLTDLTSDFTGLGDTGETLLAQSGNGGLAEFLAPLRFESETPSENGNPEGSDLSVERALASGREGSRVDLDYRGVEVFSDARTIALADWALVVKIDSAEVMAPLNDLVRAGIAVLLLGSLVAGLLAWQVSNHIRKPILEMRDAAVEVARGNREILVPNARSDELGELANSFNTMTSELNLLAGSLERQVADRTAELELRNHEMRDLLAAKETFLAGVSHEVRGPLTAMMGFLDLSRDESLSDVVDRGPMLDAAMTQAEEVLILIEDLLAAARAESGTLKLASVRVNLEAQIAQVVEGLPPDRQKKVEVSTSTALALGDPSRARQVIRNLVTNAFRYGGPEIRIRAFTVGDRTTVVVEDNGEGIPVEDQSQIFQAYRQSSSGRQVAESVGLGLHVSRQLAELMSGRLDYKYEDGWSLFALDLPAYSEEVAD